jgi:hypothetical protein
MGIKSFFKGKSSEKTALIQDKQPGSGSIELGGSGSGGGEEGDDQDQAQTYVYGLGNEDGNSTLNILRRKWNELMDFLAPFSIELLVPVLVGLTMCFFGGNFYPLIAAAEAYRMIGCASSIEALKAIGDGVGKAWEANEKDNKEDLDGDGIPDWQQTGSTTALAQRKALVVAKAVDTNALSSAVTELNTSFMAVVATLKLQFCMAVTLGNSIADLLEKPSQAVLGPIVKSVLPSPTLTDHIPTFVKYLVKIIAISMAWCMQKYLSAVQAGLRGGLMASRAFMAYLIKQGYYNTNHEDTIVDEIVGYSIAFYGLQYQIMSNFDLPFPLNVIFLPATFAQGVLSWFVGY